MLYALLGIAASFAIAALGFAQARSFVRGRLRYVDSVQHPGVPLIAGLGAAVVAIPIVALVPLIGVGTAIGFGLSVGMGVATGVKDIRRSLTSG